MIDIQRKEDCVGCNACVQRCPVNCISMQRDEQGFEYPKVDIDKCINCHLCERVCPVINPCEERMPVHVYAAWNEDEWVRMASSSGGIFYALAEKIINEGGVVFGARFDDSWDVVHSYTETLDGIKAFQGSKYLQSCIGDSFLNVERFLKSGRKVLFTGTSCQLAALGLFLRKDYGSQLVKVDVICHGVPSPRVWDEYLESITRPQGVWKNSVSQSTLNITPLNMSAIAGISFRDKRLGWEKYGFTVHTVARQGDKNTVSQSVVIKSEEQELLFEPMGANPYMQVFLKDLCLRPSCYACPSKCGRAHTDLTIGDFWRVKECRPDQYDEKGVSAVLVGSESGHDLLSSLSLHRTEVDYNDVLAGNHALENAAHKPHLYNYFWKKFYKIGPAAFPIVLRRIHPGRIRKFIGRVKGFIRRRLF